MTWGQLDYCFPFLMYSFYLCVYFLTKMFIEFFPNQIKKCPLDISGCGVTFSLWLPGTPCTFFFFFFVLKLKIASFGDHFICFTLSLGIHISSILDLLYLPPFSLALLLTLVIFSLFSSDFQVSHVSPVCVLFYLLALVATSTTFAPVHSILLAYRSIFIIAYTEFVNPIAP